MIDNFVKIKDTCVAECKPGFRNSASSQKSAELRCAGVSEDKIEVWEVLSDETPFLCEKGMFNSEKYVLKNTL